MGIDLEEVVEIHRGAPVRDRGDGAEHGLQTIVLDRRAGVEIGAARMTRGRSFGPRSRAHYLEGGAFICCRLVERRLGVLEQTIHAPRSGA